MPDTAAGVGRDETRARRKRGMPQGVMWAAVTITVTTTLLGLLGSCGYGPDRAGLPGDSRTLGIGVIENKTFGGELDVRLRREIRLRFLRNPRVSVVDYKSSDLVLDVTLNTLTVSRSRDLSSSSVTSLSYSLSGKITLRDNRDGHIYFRRRAQSASATLNFVRPILETPAVRDEAIDDMLAAFARQVEAQVMSTF